MSLVNLHVIGSNIIHPIFNDVTSFTLKSIYVNLMRYGFKLKDLINCNYIFKGNKLEIDKEYNVSTNSDIYVIISDETFKNNIVNKFELIELDDGNDDEYNDKLCEYFEDKDFINLLNIVKKNPEYLQLVNAYLSNGDIKEKIDIKNINFDEFNYNDEYKLLEEKLSSNLSNWDETLVKKLLTEYDGNVNLTARYLLI